MSLLEQVERLHAGQPADISRFAAPLDPQWIEPANQRHSAENFTFIKRVATASGVGAVDEWKFDSLRIDANAAALL